MGRYPLATCTIFMVLQMVAAELFTQNNVKEVTIDACSDGSYLSGGRCQQCTRCNDFEYQKSKCNSTHNSVCQCMPGFYRDTTDGHCKQCNKCAVGWGASPACTSMSNTVCVVCPKGSYSSVESSTKSCQSCTLCDRTDEFVLQDCTSKQDTTCFKVKKKDASVHAPVTTTGCLNGECMFPQDNSYLYSAPLYCAVLGAIVLGLLIYVVFRCRANQKRAQTASSCPKQNYQIVQQLPSYGNVPTHAPTSPVVFLQNGGKTVTVTIATKYTDLPSHVRRTVARSLSSDGSWLNLAHNLGFTPSHISQIQQKAEANNKRSSVGSILMSEWSRRDFSTVGVIIHALASINRLDLVALVQNSNSMKGSEIV